MKYDSSNKRCAILQSNYIPWKGYFDLINSVDEFVIYDDVQFTKNDWRNRNRIKTPHGVQWLTIPVNMRGRMSRRIDEIEVADSKWASKHWMTLTQNYSKAECFSKFKDVFESFYLGCSHDKLTDINQQLIQTINSILGIKTIIRNINDFEITADRCTRLVKVCQAVGASVYVSGPAAQSYLDTKLFLAENIEVSWMDYSGYSEYSQLFPPFSHEVSILDLIFNQGDMATSFLKSFSKPHKVTFSV